MGLVRGLSGARGLPSGFIEKDRSGRASKISQQKRGVWGAEPPSYAAIAALMNIFYGAEGDAAIAALMNRIL